MCKLDFFGIPLEAHAHGDLRWTSVIANANWMCVRLLPYGRFADQNYLGITYQFFMFRIILIGPMGTWLMVAGHCQV